MSMKYKALIISTFLLLCSCNSSSEETTRGLMAGRTIWDLVEEVYTHFILKPLALTEKDKFDKAVTAYYDRCVNEGKDTTKFVVDLAEIMPFEWDTLCYFRYSSPADENISKMLIEYVKEHNLSSFEAIHLLKDGKIVYNINLTLCSDDEKGSFFCTKKDMIKRARNDAKFHVQKKKQFYIFRDMTEEYVPSWRYVDEYED